MNSWGLGVLRSTGFVWGSAEVLASDLGCERVCARRWHETVLARVQRDARNAEEEVPRWFEQEVMPWVRKQVSRQLPPARGALWLRYLDDAISETAAYVRFLLSGSQVFQVARHLQGQQEFLDIERPLVVPTTLPYPTFFLALEPHPAFAIWDDCRGPEFIDGCFVSQLAEGDLDLTFTVRGEQAAVGLPGVSVRLPSSGGSTQPSIVDLVSGHARRQEPKLDDAPPATGLTQRWKRQQAEATASLRRQTVGREQATAFAVNRVLKMLDLLSHLPRQDASSPLRGSAPCLEARQRVQPASAAPAAPRTIELALKPMPGAPSGVGHFRASGPVTPHWRRSHWRHQPCGPGRSERRLVRVESTRVGEGSSPPGKHRYTVNA